MPSYRYRANLTDRVVLAAWLRWMVARLWPELRASRSRRAGYRESGGPGKPPGLPDLILYGGFAFYRTTGSQPPRGAPNNLHNLTVTYQVVSTLI